MFKRSVLEKFRKKPAISKELKQILITVDELESDVTIVLTTFNPYFNGNSVEYSHKERAYMPLGNQNKSIFFFEQKGSVQLQELTPGGADSEEAAEGVEELDTKRKNKFNFCDRATQTANFVHSSKSSQTEALPQLLFEGNVSPASIVDSYKKEGSAKEEKDEDTNDARKRRKKSEKTTRFADHRRFMRLCERMVDQNLLSDVYIDYSFYDTPSDEFKERGLGSLLVLWKFSHEPMKRMAVTNLSWNPLHPDMFAASFGSYDIARKEQAGCICLFTLKCPSYPEKVICCQSGVFCVEVCSICPYLLAAGFADGTVAVYDVRSNGHQPCAVNKNKKQEHIDVVHQVHWLADNVDGQHNFCSLAADNRVINWLLTKTELLPSEIINLQENCLLQAVGSEASTLKSRGIGVSFHPTQGDLFLVATENGSILKCSNSSVACVYSDHTNAVYSVHWNPYHPKVFLSCSADWTIKIWDYEYKESVFTFDLLNEVKDAVWAPFSSTLFAAISDDGKVHIFDLLMNKQQPTSSYVIFSGKKKINLISVQFNPTKPIIIIGDDRGSVVSFKLSPNLRSSLKAFQSMEYAKFAAAEKDKMEKILRLSRHTDDSKM